MTIKLVGFDLDDCLFDSTGLSLKARLKGIEAMIKLGLEIKKEEAKKILSEIVEEYGSNFSKHFNYFIRRLNLVHENINLSYNMQYKYIAAAVMAYHKEKIESICLYNDVKECLSNLRERNIKTAIITDGIPIKQYEKILRLEIDHLIDLVLITDQIGIRKPNPSLFEYCLKKFNVKGQETIYIGDRLDKDIEPALKNGIHSIFIHRGGKYDLSSKIEDKGQNIKPTYEINSLDEIVEIISDINSK